MSQLGKDSGLTRLGNGRCGRLGAGCGRGIRLDYRLKQHYLIDAIGGILLAEVLYAWNKRSNAYLYVKGFFERVNASLRSLSRKKKGGYA